MKRKRVVAMSSRLALAIILVAVAGLVSACGNSYPSEATARKIMEDLLSKSQGLRVRSFTKTNGIGDDKHYALEYRAELECLAQGHVMLWTSLKPCEIGKILTKSGKIEFEKTENGWRGVMLDDVNIR